MSTSDAARATRAGRSLTCFTQYGADGASSRVRVFDWLDFLGISAQTHTYLDSASMAWRNVGYARLKRLPAVEVRLRVASRRASSGTVLISKAASPLTSGALEERLLTKADHGVYDFDDALWEVPHRGPVGVFSQARLWERAVRAADVVIAGSEYLADRAADHNPNVVMIPSCVDPAGYRQKEHYDLEPVPTAIWIGSPNTERFLLGVSEPLLRLHRRCGLRLRVISAGDQPLGDLGAMVDRVEWGNVNVFTELRAADLAIAPLDDTPVARGKCAYKVIQYGAAALPIVGSPVGANERAITLMGGVPASDASDWVDGVTEILTESSASRQRRGTKARATVEGQYSFAAWQKEWKRATRVE